MAESTIPSGGGGGGD
jgi:hypothetical protein